MGASFNLSILECKYHIQVHNQLQIHTFNLSILECKCQQTEPGRDYLETFNLTILECKASVKRKNDRTGKSVIQ